MPAVSAVKLGIVTDRRIFVCPSPWLLDAPRWYRRYLADGTAHDTGYRHDTSRYILHTA